MNTFDAILSWTKTIQKLHMWFTKLCDHSDLTNNDDDAGNSDKNNG